MKTKIKIIGLVFVTASLNMACNNNPKVITASNENETSTKSSGIFSESTVAEPSAQIDFNTPFTEGIHKVVVNEVLPAAKYVYLNVSEGGKQFWIATGKKEIKVGEAYYYKNGLLKTNFESKEHNRVFETVYLVTNLVAERHGNNIGDLKMSSTNTNKTKSTKTNAQLQTNTIVQQKGSIKIAELLKDPKKYEGKTIQLTGVCTKVNAGIMDRNWIHIKDGSKDDYDLVITSDTFVPEGKTFTMKAVVTLNKDFGAGYVYELILENGVLVK
jgi:hypothetical protein